MAGWQKMLMHRVSIVLFGVLVKSVGALSIARFFTSQSTLTAADISHGDSSHDYSAAEKNTSIMLMGASTFIMGAFYFVNNSRMKAHSWSVISSTVCVFIAISSYSLVNLGFEYLNELKSQHMMSGEGAADDVVALLKFMAISHLIYFSITEVILGYVCGALFQNQKAHKNSQLLCTQSMKLKISEDEKLRTDFWSQLLGNFLMFSGLTLFASIQKEVPFFSKSVWHSLTVVPVLALYIGLLLCLMKLVHAYRMNRLRTVKGALEQRRAEMRWDEESTSCIIGLGGVSLAFLIIQAVQFGIVGALPEANGWISAKALPPPPEITALLQEKFGMYAPQSVYFQPTEHMKAQLLLIVFCIFLLASLVLQFLTWFQERVRDKVYDLNTPRPEDIVNDGAAPPTAGLLVSVLLQLVKMFTVIFCTAFGWGLLTVTRWYCSFINLNDIILYKTFVAVAICLVAFAVIAFLDAIYSLFANSPSSGNITETKKNSRLTETSNPSSPKISITSPEIASPASATRTSMELTNLVRRSTQKMMKSATESFGLDRADTLEEMIAALGVISGAGFEEAFGSASAVLAESMDLFPENRERGRTLTTACICTTVIVVMVPAWKWYILPTVHRLTASSS